MAFPLVSRFLAIGAAHLVDKLAYVRGYSWSATTTSRLPAPIRSETRAMPTDDRIRLDDRQRIASLRKQSIEANKYQPIKKTKGLPSRSRAPQNVDLLPKHPDQRFAARGSEKAVLWFFRSVD